MIEENHSFTDIVGNPAAPFINSLIGKGALLTQSYAVTHPSQPNYLALFSGSTQGVVDDLTPPGGSPFSGPSFGGKLLGAGFSFAGYSEDLPYAGYEGDAFNGYRRAHNPWSSFADVPRDASRPWSDFPVNGRFETLPTVSFVVPNVSHDMHSGSIGDADLWLETNLGAYITWAGSHHSLFLLTWDEDDLLSGNHVPTVLVGPMVHPGPVPQKTDHFGILRTLEEWYGLAPSGATADAAPLEGLWSPSPVPSGGESPHHCAALGLEGSPLLLALVVILRRGRSPPKKPGPRGHCPGDPVG